MGDSQNGFFLESFIDEVAAAGNKDPYELRRRLLAKSPRHLAVLDKAAQNAGWGKPLPAGRFRGIATVTSYFGYVAQVIEISVNRNKRDLKVDRVVCALDCGRPVNPANIEAQVQSCVVYGLTAALHGAITISAGASSRTTSTITPCCGSTKCPQWKCTSCQARCRPPALASLPCRRWPRRYAMRFSRRPASASAACRSARKTWPDHWATLLRLSAATVRRDEEQFR